MDNIERQELIQEGHNIELGEELHRSGISKLKLTTFGNSIANGYACVRTAKPLLLRNETLEVILGEEGVDLEKHNFSRAQNNCDDHLLSWLVNNVKEADINAMNRNDYGTGPTSMSRHIGVDQTNIDNYYPETVPNDKGIQDVIYEDEDDLANIVIYDGCTGTFLDNITRGGSKNITAGFKKDVSSLEGILKIIQANNRGKGSNTQFYICGVPNFLGIGASNIINSKLKELAEKYPCAVYVEPIKSKMFYQPALEDTTKDTGTLQRTFKKFLSLRPDIHYSEMEYLEFNNNIVRSIAENYEVTRAIINIDRDACKLSEDLELHDQEHVKDSYYIKQKFSTLINKQLDRISDSNKRQKVIDKSRKILLNEEPGNLYYIGNKTITTGVDKDKLNESRHIK